MYHGKESSTPKDKYHQGWLVYSLLQDSNSLSRSQPGGSRSQAEALEAEGVEVETNAMGEHLESENTILIPKSQPLGPPQSNPKQKSHLKRSRN